MLSVDTSEHRYEVEAKKLIRTFDKETQLKAMTAVNDLLSMNFSWEHIYNSLTKKSANTWKTYGFGLCFDRGFINNVKAAIQRNKEALNNDEKEFYRVLEEEPGNQFTFPE